MDNYRDLSYSTVALAPSPATTDTSLTVRPGDGAKFAEPPFDMFLAPPEPTRPTLENTERVRVTDKIGDTFTIERHQGVTGAQSVAVGWQVYAGVNEKTIRELAPKARTVHVINGPVEAVWGHDYYCEAGSNYGLAIPTAVGHAGEDIRVRVINGTHAVTVKGAQTIDGKASLVMGLEVGGAEPEEQLRAATITSDGAVLHTF
jgi:hypothetical protein